MENNYYSIHCNKRKRKSIGLGKFMSPERKRNLALKLYQNLPNGLKNDTSELIIFSKGNRKDYLSEIIRN